MSVFQLVAELTRKAKLLSRFHLTWTMTSGVGPAVSYLTTPSAYTGIGVGAWIMEEANLWTG